MNTGSYRKLKLDKKNENDKGVDECNLKLSFVQKKSNRIKSQNLIRFSFSFHSFHNLSTFTKKNISV